MPHNHDFWPACSIGRINWEFADGPYVASGDYPRRFWKDSKVANQTLAGDFNLFGEEFQLK